LNVNKQGKIMNKIYKILLSIITILNSTFLCAMESQTAATSERNLLDLPPEMLVQIAQELDDNRDLGRLNQAAWRTQEITQEILQQRHEQWLSKNRITVDCSFLRDNYSNVDDFINAVLEKLVLAYTAHPDRWFELVLASNNLGNLSQNDLKRVFDNICQTVKSLRIHLISLHLYHNQLQTLPNNIFDNLGNLKELYLSFNRLQTLPNNIFDRLGNLQKLGLFNNNLQTLPNYIFDNLGNLKELYLFNNHLQTLPNNIFDNLGNLKELHLYNNQLDHATQNALQIFQAARPEIDIDF